MTTTMLDQRPPGLNVLQTHFQTGARLANNRGFGRIILAKYPEAMQRSVVLSIVRPHPDVAKIPDWIKRFGLAKLKPGAAYASNFVVYMNSNALFEVGDGEAIPNPTVRFYIDEATCWELAARRETIYTAHSKGRPMYVDGRYALRDMELIDDMMEMIYQTLKADGLDLADLLLEIS